MKENSTLLFIIDDFSNNNYLANVGELFFASPTGKLADAFKKLECAPPDRVIRDILSKVCQLKCDRK